MSRKWKHFMLWGVFNPIVIVGSVTYWAADRAVVKQMRAVLATTPPGWMDSIPTRAPLPAEVRALALPRTEDGDAAALVRLAITGTEWSPDDNRAAYERMSNGEETIAADSAAWLAIAADTMLDRLVHAARHTRWDGMDVILPPGDAGPGEDLFELRGLSSWELVAAGRGLAIRARTRLADNDRQSALEDVQTIMGIGEHLTWRHPGAGRFAGPQLILLAARELGHHAQVVGDATLADVAGRVEAWAETRREFDAIMGSWAFGAEPDSALVLVHDATLPLGLRCHALLSYTFARSLRPRVRLFGFPSSVGDELDRLATDPDPDLARFAQIVARTVAHFNDLSMLERQRYTGDRLIPLVDNLE